MMTRQLVVREAHVDGIRYKAGESAAPFLASIQTSYLCGVKSRASWLVDHLAEYNELDFNTLMRWFFDNWVEEFQAVERSLGGNT